MRKDNLKNSLKTLPLGLLILLFLSCLRHDENFVRVLNTECNVSLENLVRSGFTSVRGSDMSIYKKTIGDTTIVVTFEGPIGQQTIIDKKWYIKNVDEAIKSDVLSDLALIIIGTSTTATNNDGVKKTVC